ncbi:MAG: MarR family winged helix-turn-helix transcriptional regulator [Bryobacteraceae bacterium]
MLRYIKMETDKRADLEHSEYQKLEEFRFQIRRFLNFSEAAARIAGVEAQQHQALLALKALPEGSLPTIGHLAERLLLKHHSAVGLVDRLQVLGLVTRRPRSEDARQVLVRLTSKGERLLHRLSLAHRLELEETGPELAAALRSISRKAAQTQTL